MWWRCISELQTTWSWTKIESKPSASASVAARAMLATEASGPEFGTRTPNEIVTAWLHPGDQVAVGAAAGSGSAVQYSRGRYRLTGLPVERRWAAAVRHVSCACGSWTWYCIDSPA